MLVRLFRYFSNFFLRPKMLPRSPSVPSAILDEDPLSYWHQSKFQTCCCHVKTVATVLGVMSIVSSCVLITYSVYNLIETNQGQAASYDQFRANMPLAMSLVFSMLSLIFVCLMFYGLSKEYPLLLIAHLVVHALTIFCWSAIFTVKIVYVAKFWELLRRASLLSIWMVTLVILLSYLILQFYYFYVSYKCLLYVKAKKTAVGAVEMFNNDQWAMQTHFGVPPNHPFNGNGLFAPPYYTVINNPQSPSYMYPASAGPPPYESCRIPAISAAVTQTVAPQSISQAPAQSPPPIYTVDGRSAGYNFWK